MRKIPWGMIFLGCWLLILVASVTLYLKYLQPAKLSNTISLYFKDFSNLRYHSERISFIFFPEPTIRLNKATLSNKAGSFKFSVEKAQATLSWRSLFIAKPVFRSIEVFAPQFNVIIPKTPKGTKKALAKIKTASQKEAQAIVKNAAAETYNNLLNMKLPNPLIGLNAYIRKGNMKIYFADSKDVITIKGIDVDAQFPGFLDGALDLRLQKSHVSMKGLPELLFSQSALIIGGWQQDPKVFEASFMTQTKVQVGSLEKVMGGPIRPEYKYFPMTVPARIRLQNTFSITKKTKRIVSEGFFQARAVLPMNKYNTPIDIDLPFSFIGTNKRTSTDNLIIPTVTPMTAYHVNAFLKENTNLPKKAVDAASFTIESIKVKNLNLRMDRDALILNGEILGIYPLSPLFQGHMKIKNFNLPRWAGPIRNISEGLIKALSKIKGEANIIVNKRGVIAYNLFAGVYDIRGKGIASCGNFLKPNVAINLAIVQDGKKEYYANLNPLFPEINNVAFTPIKLPPPVVTVSTPEDTSEEMFVNYRIAITIPNADIWKLSLANASCLISPDEKEAPTIAVTVADLYSGTADAHILLADDGINYIKATLNDINLGPAIRRIAGFDAITGSLDTQINMNFSGNILNEILSTLKISTHGTLTNGIIKDETKTTMQKFQKIDFDIAAQAYDFYSKTKTLPPLFSMTGNYNVHLRENNISTKISTSATLDFSTDNGLPIRMIPQSSKIEYYYVGNDVYDKLLINGFGMLGYDHEKNELLTIENFVGTLNNEELVGNFYIKNTNKPTWSGIIQFTSFNIDKYIHTTKEENTPPTQLPIQFLKYNDLDFTITSKTLTFLNMKIKNFTTKIKAKNGELQIGKLTGNLPTEGILQGILKASVIPGHMPQDDQLQTEIRLQAKNMDLLAVSKMRKQSYNIAGKALLKLDTNGIFKTTQDILANLDGKWSVAITNGYFQSSQPTSAKMDFEERNQRPLGKRRQQKNNDPTKTLFDSIFASGTITQGILTEKLFEISGPGLKVTGEGSINLVNKKIEGKAIATLFGIPEIPIQISGTITDPKTETEVMNALVNTLGNISIGTFELVGFVLTMPFRLFSKIPNIK